MHASQCAMSAKVAIRSRSTAAPYSEYLSIFLATLTKRNKRAVFSKPIRVVVCNNQPAISCTQSTKPHINWCVHQLKKPIVPTKRYSSNFHVE